MALDLMGAPVPTYNVETVGGVLSFLLSILAVGTFVHVAANVVLKRSSIHEGLVVGAVGILAALLVYNLADKFTIVGYLAALAAFCGVASVVYRKKFREGAVVGAVAWAAWIIANVTLGYLQAHWVSNPA